MRDVIFELAALYFEKTGDSPEMSFYCWLEATGIEPNYESFLRVLNNPELYDFPKS